MEHPSAPLAISYYLPPTVLDNDMLAAEFDDRAWTAAQIYRKTGVRKRHLACDLLASDLAVRACETLFDEHGIDRSGVEFLLLDTQSPDHLIPPTSCFVQHRLGLPKTCGALDYDLGCSGYVYGLALAKGIISADVAENVLFVTSETGTKWTHKGDRSARVLFGEAATATYITRDSLPHIGRFVLGTDGGGAYDLYIPAGGLAMPRSEKTCVETTDDAGNVRTLENSVMNGAEIFRFSLDVAPKLVAQTLEKNGLQASDIELFVLHQANKLILNALRDMIGVERERWCVDLEEVGNTAQNSIPLALRRAMDRDPDRFAPGTRVLIAGFGVGYSWGGTVLTL